MTLMQETFNAYNSFILLAVPFFLLTANLMNIGGTTERLMRLSRWQRFWRVDIPSGMIPLVWNGMMSFGGGWFFLVASEMATDCNICVRCCRAMRGSPVRRIRCSGGWCTPVRSSGGTACCCW